MDGLSELYFITSKNGGYIPFFGTEKLKFEGALMNVIQELASTMFPQGR